jgi:hypothetical protein
LGNLDQYPATALGKPRMGTLGDPASMFAEQGLQFLVENVGAENIGEASECAPD